MWMFERLWRYQVPVNLHSEVQVCIIKEVKHFFLLMMSDLSTVLRKTKGSYHTYLSLVKLQPWFLILQWKTCLRQNCNPGSCICSEGAALGQNTLMMISWSYLILNYLPCTIVITKLGQSSFNSIRKNSHKTQCQL